MAKNVTPRQVDLFHKLTTDREFPDGTNIDTLRSQFAALDSRSASAWIERAMALPRSVGDGDDDSPALIPPTF